MKITVEIEMKELSRLMSLLNAEEEQAELAPVEQPINVYIPTSNYTFHDIYKGWSIYKMSMSGRYILWYGQSIDDSIVDDDIDKLIRAGIHAIRR